MQIYLLLTQNCNLSCSFCIRGNTINNYLDFNTLKSILKRDDFSQYQLLLTGGEPSLHPQFNDIINICKDKFKGICINTNGVQNDWIDKLTYKDIHIQISLDGTKEIHNKKRSNAFQNLFSSVEKTILKIEKFNISYNISTTVNYYNYENIKELMNYLTKFKLMKFWKLSPELPFGCSDLSQIISIYDWNNLVEYLVENACVRLHIKKLFDFNLLDKFREKYGDISLPGSNCDSGKGKFYIYPDFTVYPCTCLTDFPLANLKEESFEEIKNNEKRRIFLNYKVDQTSFCNNCKYLKQCNGGCMGMSYRYFGKLMMGDYRCPLMIK